MRYILISILSLFISILAIAEPNELRVGWIGALTGNAAAIGMDAKAAIDSVVKKYAAELSAQNKKITILAEDDSYDVAKAVRAYDKLVSIDKVKIVFVATYGAIFTLAPRAERDDVLLIDTLDCNEDIAALPGKVFCLASRTESIGDTIYEAIALKETKKIAVLAEEEAWFNFVNNYLLKRLTDAKIEFLNIKVDSTESDFKSYVAKIRNYQPDGIVLLGNDQFGSALKQLKTALPESRYFSIGSITSPGFKKLAGETIEGVYTSDFGPKLTPIYTEYREQFKKEAGREPFLDLAASPAFDAMRVLVAVYKDSKDTSSESMYAGLLKVPDTEGASGPIHVDQDGAVRTIRDRLFIIRGGRVTEP